MSASNLSDDFKYRDFEHTFAPVEDDDPDYCEKHDQNICMHCGRFHCCTGDSCDASRGIAPRSEFDDPMD